MLNDAQFHNTLGETCSRERAQGANRKAWLGGLVVLLLGVAGFVFKSGQTFYHEHKLSQLDAEYSRDFNKFAHLESKRPASKLSLLSDFIGNPLASNVASVKLDKPTLNDRDLSFLSNLQRLKSLELSSNSATDRTLELISRLPDLKYLSLAGNQFTVYGLLHLRSAQQLRQLEIDLTKFTPVELAVLKSELPEVNVKDVNAPAPERRLQSLAEAA